jgi:Domain of unknown function (DUF4431)
VLAVFAEEKLQLTFRRPVGRRVAVRGSPFTAHTSHHHAPIVMQVSEIGARWPKNSRGSAQRVALTECSEMRGYDCCARRLLIAPPRERGAV